MQESYWKTVPGKSIPSSLELYPIVYNYLKKGYEILDIGCGSGKVSLEFASLGYSVMGIDLNPEAVKFSEAAAKCLDKEKKLKGKVEFRVEDASNLPFQESSFDFAVMQAFLTSVPTP